MIDAAKALGFAVYTSGNRPDELGHRRGDGYVPADYSDPEQVLAAAKSIGAEAICPSCNDFSAISSAYAAHVLGLPGHDAPEPTLILHHKDRYRALAASVGVPTPRAMSFDRADAAIDAGSALRLPVMVKPVDLTGGKGITRVSDPGALPDAVTRAFALSRQQRVVIEEFIEGTRHGITTFIRDKRVVFAMSDNEVYFTNPYLVSGAYSPGDVSAGQESAVCRDVETIARALDLRDGLVHVQFVLAESGPVIIEICRRPPGDLYVKLVSFVTGVDYPSWIVRSFAGLDSGATAAPASRSPVLRHCVMSRDPGRVDHVHVAPCVRDKIIDQMLWADGARIDNPLVDKMGIVFVGFETAAELREIGPRMHDLIYPVVTH